GGAGATMGAQPAGQPPRGACRRRPARELLTHRAGPVQAADSLSPRPEWPGFDASTLQNPTRNLLARLSTPLPPPPPNPQNVHTGATMHALCRLSTSAAVVV